jgi:single-stranded-DNA-specific exonuclease
LRPRWPQAERVGRLCKAEAGVRLLIAEDPGEALTVASELDAMNRERQKIEEEILDEARYILTSSYDSECRTIVLASDKWHQGVVGVVASKLVDEFYKPTVLISLSDGMGKGSARSILLSPLQGLVVQVMPGGLRRHKYAAGS